MTSRSILEGKKQAFSGSGELFHEFEPSLQDLQHMKSKISSCKSWVAGQEDSGRVHLRRRNGPGYFT